MNKIYLSAKSFNSLQFDAAGSKTQRVWTHEFRGLGISIGLNRKSLIYKYKSPADGKLKIITIDTFLSDEKVNDDLIDDVVGTYYHMKSKIRAGICPITEKEEARSARLEAAARKAEAAAQAKQQAFTLDDAHKIYCEHRSFTHDIKAGTRKMYDKLYLSTIAPALGDRLVTELDPRKDINVFLDGIASNSVHNTVVVILRKIQDACYNQGLIDNYFILKVKNRDVGERDRLIEDLPGFLVWLKTPEFRSYKNALRAQLLHATRATELNSLQWSEIDFDKKIISIPWIRRKGAKAAKQSTQKPLLIPLTKPMMNILDEQRGFSEQYVFPLMAKDKPANNSVIYALLRNCELGFSSHDIRRTVADTLEGMDDVTMDDAGLILDHAVKGANANYTRKNKAVMLLRKCAIYDKWHTYLDKVGGIN